MTPKIFNVVFVVAHPDDEAIWVGGLISELSRLACIQVHIICLTTGRGAEQVQGFHDAHYAHAYVGSEEVHSAQTPLSSIATTTEAGLKQLGLASEDISALITHSPYGDEHGHPHHTQTYRELYTWTRATHIPFGYFSTALITYFSLTPLTTHLGRIGGLHLMVEAVCKNNLSLLRRLFSKSVAPYHTPARYLGFVTTGSTKYTMIERYGLEADKIRQGYTAGDHGAEGLYLIDEAALAPFHAVISQMEVPGRPKLFPL